MAQNSSNSCATDFCSNVRVCTLGFITLKTLVLFIFHPIVAVIMCVMDIICMYAVMREEEI